MIDVARAQLGATKSGLPIGYRLLDMNGKAVTKFTRHNVVETTIPGIFEVRGGIDYPPTGGAIVWGTKDKDIASVGFGPAPEPTPPVDLGPVREDIAAARADILTAILAITTQLRSEVNAIQPGLLAQMNEERRQATIAEQERSKKAPVTLESLAARLEDAEDKNRKLIDALNTFFQRFEYSTKGQ